MEKIIENIKLNYIDNDPDQAYGFDQTVVLLHGWGANIDTMEPIGRLLRDRYRTILVDMPGFGGSEEPSEVLDSFDYARIILKLLDELNVDKASFIGHSFGGKISAIIAAKSPSRVDRLVLIDASGLKPKRNVVYYIQVYSFKLGKKLLEILPISNKKERIEAYKNKSGSDDYQNASGIMRQIMVKVVNENIKDLLGNIKADTLLIWGDKDEATPLYMGKTYESEIKSSGLVVLEGAGHYSYLDDYPTFSAVINSFFKEN